MSMPARKPDDMPRIRRASHTIAELVRDIGDSPLLSDGEVAGLSRVVRSPDATPEARLAARTDLVERNLRLVIRLARILMMRGEDLGELVSDGVVGLTRAAELYDPDSGFRFSTYAAWWIRQSITKARYDHANGRPWRIPIHIHEARNRIEAYRRERHSAGEDVGFVEAAAHLGYGSDAKWIARADAVLLQEKQVERGAASDRFRGEMSDAAFTLDLAREGDDAEAAERAEGRDIVRSLVDRLPPREREVIRLYYRFDPIPGEDLADRYAGSALMPGNAIAKHLGVSRERVRQIRVSALEKIRRMAEEAGCF